MGCIKIRWVPKYWLSHVIITWHNLIVQLLRSVNQTVHSKHPQGEFVWFLSCEEPDGQSSSNNLVTLASLKSWRIQTSFGLSAASLSLWVNINTSLILKCFYEIPLTVHQLEMNSAAGWDRHWAQGGIAGLSSCLRPVWMGSSPLNQNTGPKLNSEHFQ